MPNGFRRANESMTWTQWTHINVNARMGTYTSPLEEMVERARMMKDCNMLNG